jgi:ABC-type Fe3+-hydroxamate transport system substrate-binding protein
MLITGDRHWRDKELIRSMIRDKMPDLVIVGDAKGTDILAYECCKEDGFTVISADAKWWKYGDAAGPIRNREMLDLKPDLVLAFHDDLAHSKGTKDTVTEAKRRGIKVQLISHNTNSTEKG